VVSFESDGFVQWEPSAFRYVRQPGDLNFLPGAIWIRLLLRSAAKLNDRSVLNVECARMRQSEFPMNIFYIIGVVVVVVLIAGFLGLRV
jgi:hypothetical protein